MSTLDGNFTFKGTVAIQGQFYPPALSINGSHISQDANNRIPAETVEHQFPIAKELFGPATTIANQTSWLFAANAEGELVGIDALIATAATGADRTVTIDVQKSTGGGAFATVLSTTIDIDDGTTVRTPLAATIASPTYVAGDIFQAIATVAGSAPDQALGLLLMVYAREMPA